MKENGSKQLYLRKVGNQIDHITCAGYAFVYTKLWFDGYKKGSTSEEKVIAGSSFILEKSHFLALFSEEYPFCKHLIL